MMMAGSAGGKIRTGQYITGEDSPVSRMGLTLQQAMAVPVDSWGTDSLDTNKTIPGLIV